MARAEADGDVLWPAGTAPQPHRAGPIRSGSWTRCPRPPSTAERPELPPRPTGHPAAGGGLSPIAALVGALAADLALGIVVTVVVLVRSASYGTEDGWIDTVGEVVHRGIDAVDLTYRAEGAGHTEAAMVLYPEDYTVGRRYPVTYDSDEPSHVRLPRGATTSPTPCSSPGCRPWGRRSPWPWSSAGVAGRRPRGAGAVEPARPGTCGAGR